MSKYLNSSASPGGDGSIGTPWDTVQAALDGVASGEEVLSTGSETISSDNTSSTSGALGSLIEFVGVDGSYARVDGTRYDIDCNSGAYNGFSFTNTYYYIEAFEIVDSTDKAIISSAQNIYMYDCVFSGCTYGFYTSASFSSVNRCRFINNTYGYWNNNETGFVYNCVFGGHSNYAVTGNNVCTNVIDNLFYDNSSDNIFLYESAVVNGNIFDNGGAGINCYLANRTYVLKNNLFTNMTTGVTSSGRILAQNNAYFNNGTDISNTSNYKVLGKGNTDIALGAAPYVDASYATSRDYTTDFTNTSIVQLDVPFVGNDTENKETVGAEPASPTGTTPTFVGHTGAQMLTDNKLVLKFAAATDATNILGYISTSAITYAASERAGMVAGNATQMIIANEADGTPLVPGTLYYFATRAINISGADYDSNVVTGSYTAAGRGNTPMYIKIAPGT